MQNSRWIASGNCNYTPFGDILAVKVRLNLQFNLKGRRFLMNIASIIFCTCVFAAFCVYIVEKILQTKIDKNAKQSAAHIVESIGQKNPTFPVVSHNLIRTNNQLHKWTTGLLVTRFVLLIVGASDYFWFM